MSVAALTQPPPLPPPALLVRHTALHDSITINYNAKMLAVQLAQTVRRSTPSPRFVSSSPPRAMLLFCCFERFGTVDFLVIFSFITPSFPCFIYFSVFPQFCYGYSSYVNSCLTVNFQMSSSHTLHFAYIIKTYNTPPRKFGKRPFQLRLEIV